MFTASQLLLQPYFTERETEVETGRQLARAGVEIEALAASDDPGAGKLGPWS